MMTEEMVADILDNAIEIITLTVDFRKWLLSFFIVS